MSDKEKLKPLRIVSGGILEPSFPKTAALRFEKYVLCDPKGTDFQFLVQLSDARKEFATALDGGSPSSVLRLVSDYLPLLWRFVSSVKKGTGVRFSSSLEIDWSSAFQDNCKKKSKIFSFSSVDVELLMVLECFAVAHLQVAAEMLSQMSTEKQVADSMKDINVHFLNAAGIFKWIVENILPFTMLSKERPIELLQPFHVCMWKACTLMANSVLLRKAIEDQMKPLSQSRQRSRFFSSMFI
jgi:hypothetical protein